MNVNQELWFLRGLNNLKEDKKEIEDDPDPRWSIPPMDKNIGKISALTWKYHQLSIHIVSAKIGLGKECVWHILHENFNLRKVH